MARRPVEITVHHVFRDGTVTQDPSGHSVPREIVMRIHEIAEDIRKRQARELAKASPAAVSTDD